MKEAKRPAVASMSIGGPQTPSVSAAIKKLFDSGVVVSVAAGNDAGDACEGSPASAEYVSTTLRKCESILP